MKANKMTALTMSAVLTLGVLSGCAGSKESGGASGGAGQSASNVNPTGMPIVKEPVKLKFFTGKSPQTGNKFEDTLVWKEYAKQSGIDVEFQLVPFESLTEKRNLALAGGDYPDAFYSARVPVADLMKYGSQGVFVRLNDLIDKHAPNLKKLLEKYPDLKKGLTMPDGGIYSFPSFYSPEFLPMLIGTPLWINKTWLDKLNMKEPETTEEFYAYLKAVKESDPNGNGQKDEVPLSGMFGIQTIQRYIGGAWGFGNRGAVAHPYVDVEPGSDKLRFYRLDPKYKEVLQYMNKLYTEGLIDKEIFTLKDTALYAKGEKGLLGAAFVPHPQAVMNQKGYVGLGALKGPHGDQLFVSVKNPIAWPGAFVITDKNKNPEATVRWIDHFYGDEGATFYFMGQKDVTYIQTPDGKLEYVDDIKKNPNGLTLDQAAARHFTWPGGSYPGYVQEKYFKGSESLPESIEAGKKASRHLIKDMWYSFNFTEEETAFMNSKGADIQKLITETEANLINGTASFDDWDKYVATVQKMGVDQYLNIYRAAYERYSGGK
ncbi:extracellular solute-binding protein [Paenibacillus oleatilyticus]|uniref:extracellular solute-binding protein n=1 Tax=Paenibacillus oleatilyticus TaxID=2594886 RepID=UPI001C1F534C|nr:extracellular solute-binding protein [Paenibacillus oleatilyticus]MBU7317934.1 extracellular solute-binding protein [Paenibacillus oleatilyticus]